MKFKGDSYHYVETGLIVALNTWSIDRNSDCNLNDQVFLEEEQRFIIERAKDPRFLIVNFPGGGSVAISRKDLLAAAQTFEERLK